MVVRTTSSAGMSVPSTTAASHRSSSSHGSWLGDVFGLNGTSAANVVTPNGSPAANTNHRPDMKHRFSEPTRNRSNTTSSQPQQQAYQQQQEQKIEWEESYDDGTDPDSPLLQAPSFATTKNTGGGRSLETNTTTAFDFGGLYSDDGACNLCANMQLGGKNGNRSGGFNNNHSMEAAELLEQIRLLQDQNATLVARLENSGTGRPSSSLQLQRSLSSALQQQASPLSNTAEAEVQALRAELERLQQHQQQEQRISSNRSVDETELYVLREELHQLTGALSKERALFAEFKASAAAAASAASAPASQQHANTTSVPPYDLNVLAEREATIKSLRQQCMSYCQELTEMAVQHENQLTIVNQELRQAVHDRSYADSSLEQLQHDYQASIVELEERLDEWQDRAIAAEAGQRSHQDITVQSLQAALKTSQEGIDQLNREYRETKERHGVELQKWQDLANEWEASTRTLQQDGEVRQTEFQQQVESLQNELAVARADRTEANQSIEHMVETVKQLETKYLDMEHQLFETKLQLTAADEERTELLEEHEAQIAEMDETIRRILAEKSDLENDHADQIRQWEERLEAISEENGERAGEREMRVSELEAAVEEMDREKAHLVQDFELEKAELMLRIDSLSQEKNQVVEQRNRQLQLVEEKKVDDNYDLLRLNALVSEVDRLERSVQEEKRNGESMVMELRQELQTLRDRESALARHVEEQRTEFEQCTRELQQVIADREARIHELTNADSEHGAVLALKAENGHLQMQLNEMRATMDDDDRNNHYDMTSDDANKLIRERDDAIASLVTQTQEQEEIIDELQERIRDLLTKKTVATANASRSLDAVQVGSPSPDLVKRLEREAKVFAEQVIELDEEMQQLKQLLDERELQVSELTKELTEVRQRDTPKTATLVLDLEAEIEELREANKTQVDEIRDLRKRVLTAKSHEDEMAQLRNKMQEASVEADDYKRKAETATVSWTETQRLLAEARKQRSEIEAAMSEKLEKSARGSEKRILDLEQQLKDVQLAFDAFKARPTQVTEDEYKAVHDEVTNLRQTVNNLNVELDHSKRTIQELDVMLAERRADRAAFHEEEKEELLAEMEALSSKLEEARHRISQLQEDESMIEEFKLKLECADDSREAREKNIIDTYERKISLLTLDKDVTNDKLRKELISEREANAEEIAELNEQLKVHQQEVMQLREELDEQIEQRETRIFELEHTLEAQEQLVQNMKSEMDHLQGSMEGNAARRKEEIEEMQKELLDMTAAAAKHEREIESLKGELDTSKVTHEAELAKLKKKLSEAEGAKEKNRNAQDLQMELRVKEVKDRLEKLKFRNSSLKVENINLRERLERAENLMKENDQPEKIKSMQSELDSQSRKIKKLETELERAREPPAESRTSGRSRSLSTTRIRPPSRKPPVSTTPLKGSDMSVISSSTTAVPTSPVRKGLFSRFRSRSLSRDPTSRQAQASVPVS